MNSTARLRNGETYFFRDQGQFDLLRLRLLPELIQRRRSVKTLRIWSAGCSSGEEAYSLAMLVDMLLPARDEWDILILGSDIDESALAKARAGHYGQWSFRMVPLALKQRYFRSNGNEWLLDERIRGMVTFRGANLMGEASAAFTGAESPEMDLILCRNVFIYFDAAAIAAIASGLTAALSEGGYLMTGHTELIGQSIHHLQSRLFPEGVVYQRAAPVAVAITPWPIPAVQWSAPSTQRGPPLPVTNHAPQTSAPLSDATKRTPDEQQVAPPTSPPVVEAMVATAQEFANRGEYDRAAQACREALTIAPLAPGPYFLLAQLAQFKGDFEEARAMLEKNLYLDPRSVAAHLELAALSERTENLQRAQTLRRAALDILRSLPGDAVIEPYETTAAEMARWLAR